MQKKRFLHNLPLVLFLILTAAGVQAQAQTQTIGTFAYRSALDTVRHAGFYKITLMPDLLAKCKEDLSDLRILDSAGNTVPYVLRSDLPVFSIDNFKEFPILFNEKLKDSATELVVANGSFGGINALLLVLKNIDARRTAVLSGSDDQKKWFVIREHIGLQEARSDTADHYVQAITFPMSSYRFFKLILDDKGLLPVNILKAGITTRSFTNGKYIGVPFPALVQKDSSDKHSYIYLQYRDHYRIDKLELLLDGPALFRRHARIYDIGNSGYRLVAETELSPSGGPIPIPTVKTDSLLVDIANEDDRPLVVQAARTAQLNQYLLTRLLPGSGYALVAGNAHAEPPVYDLQYFVKELDKDPDELMGGPVQPLHMGSGAGMKPPPGDHSGLLLWSILAIVLLLLASLSFKMVKAIKQDSHDRP